jgi:hypothetical protein
MLLILFSQISALVAWLNRSVDLAEYRRRMMRPLLTCSTIAQQDDIQRKGTQSFNHPLR